MGQSVVFALLLTGCGIGTFLLPRVSSAPLDGHSILSSSYANNPFVGFYVFPHGGITLNPRELDFKQEMGSRRGSEEEATRLHEAMKVAAQDLLKTRPDIVILSTPHGYFLEDRFVLAGSPQMSGNAGWHWSHFEARFQNAQYETSKLFQHLKGKHHQVELLRLGVGNNDLALTWGEVIPWYFIQQAAQKLGVPEPQVIYIGQPPKKKMNSLSKLGKDIVDFAQTHWSQKRIAVLISGDMSHHHSRDPLAPYPYHEKSVVFDKHVRDWGQTDITPTSQRHSHDLLLKHANAITEQAGSCGYTGFVLGHSMMSRLVNHAKISLEAKFYEYAAPTYFGMMVSSWIPNT